MKFAQALSEHLQKIAGVARTSIIPLNQLDEAEISENDIYISLLETEREFLATMSPQDMDRLRAMTDVVTNLLWVTGASMLGTDPDPNLTLAGGLSRALMLEQPSLRFAVYDIGAARLLKSDQLLLACENTVNALVANHDKDDCEFIQVEWTPVRQPFWA
jgi:hypothetical protein